MLSNGQRAPYLPATWFYAGRRFRKSRLCCSGDLTGHLLQVPRWQQLVQEQQRTLHQPGHLGVALIKESWSAEACGGAEKRPSPLPPPTMRKSIFCSVAALGNPRAPVNSAAPNQKEVSTNSTLFLLLPFLLIPPKRAFAPGPASVFR